MATFRGVAGMKPNYFYRLLWFGCISVCVPLIVAGIVYDQISMRGGIARFQEDNQTSLTLIEQYTEKALSDIVVDSFQLALDPVVTGSFESPGFKDDYVKQIDLLRKLSLLKYKNSFIGSVYYANLDTGFVLSSTEGHMEYELFPYKKDIERLGQNDLDGQWAYLPASKQRGFISFALRLPSLSSAGQGLLVTQVDVSQINKYLSSVLSLTKNQTVMVVDGQRRTLFQTRKPSGADETSGGEMIGEQTLLDIGADRAQLSSFQTWGPGGEEVLISYRKAASGNTYISAIPYKTIAKEVGASRPVTALAVVVLLLLGIAVSALAIKRAYRPIGKWVDELNKETRELGEQLARSKPSLLERMLQQWLGGNYIQSRTLADECMSYGIAVNRLYVVVLVKVENLIQDKRFRPGDKPTVSFAVVNVIGELLANHPSLQGNVIHDHTGQGTVILHFDSNCPEELALAQAKRFAESVLGALQSSLKLCASAGIGRFYRHISDIQLSYKEAKLALQNRLYMDEQSVLCIAELDQAGKAASFSYPKAIELRIISALADGNKVKAREEMERFTDALVSSESYALISQSYQLLLGSIVFSIENKGGGIPDILEYDLYDQLKAMETKSEMCGWFSDVLFPLYERVADVNYSTAGKLAVQKVRQYIETHVEKDVSLAECADLFHIAPSYLSRLFKKETGCSFLEYVTSCKIEKARKMLTDTDRTINEIACAVGYSQRTFNRIFQRLFKMSPSHYRTIHR
ncbi:helix-turn-helix domain-containing protein [Paenibacillus thalictri]|uniref:AraC family transcriptional regulator n=1 Tax=Paenibacillus thalictri TaxID=2527873 RepID=A0A4Q9DMI4_9BACL|nr:helix-turn-helix domain-containing protein [Paenibacillus thalictri]TBL76497.1 AraC family transcriptional regulator [Paenibacillus thalictri]